MTSPPLLFGAGAAFLLSWLYLSTYDAWAYRVLPILRGMLGRPSFEREGTFAVLSPDGSPLLALGLICLGLGLFLRRSRR